MLRGPGPLVIDHAQQIADPAQPLDHGAAPGLGGMRGQHQVHAQRFQQLADVLMPRVAVQLGHGGRQRLPYRLIPGIAFAQLADALMFLGQVGQVEVDGEGAGHLLGPVQVPRGDQHRDRVPGRIRRLIAGVPAGLDHRVPQLLHVGQQLRADRIADDLAEDVAEQPDVASHLLRQPGPVPVPVAADVAFILHDRHAVSVIPRYNVPVNLVP